MNVIFYPADGDGFEPILPRNAAEIGPKLSLPITWDGILTVLSGKDAMDKFGNVGVRHGKCLISAVPPGLVVVFRLPSNKVLGYWRWSLRDRRGGD